LLPQLLLLLLGWHDMVKVRILLVLLLLLLLDRDGGGSSRIRPAY
jgi:hypothetical protein